MRLLAHNGEINTLLGNINWVKSKQYAKRNAISAAAASGCFIEPSDSNVLQEVKGPLVDVGRSDSANLDSILESFVRAGKTPEEALMILVPEAYAGQPRLKDAADVQAFYSYYESLQEAWDGESSLFFTSYTNNVCKTIIYAQVPLFLYSLTAKSSVLRSTATASAQRGTWSRRTPPAPRLST